MSLRGGFLGEEQTNELSSQSSKNLLNTPLANTMKKVGINPQFNNKLNQYVVRKGGQSSTSIMSGQVSPTSRDGTGGPQNSMYPQFQHLMPNNHLNHMPGPAKTNYGGQNTYDQFSQFGGDDDYMFPRADDMMGSPRSAAFYGGAEVNHLQHEMMYRPARMGPQSQNEQAVEYANPMSPQTMFRQLPYLQQQHQRPMGS